MIDPITNQHGTRNEPNTYKRGSQRIYYILCSNGLTPFIKPCGLLPFDFIKTSDHRGLYIDIDLDLILKIRYTNSLTTNVDFYEQIIESMLPKTKYI